MKQPILPFLQIGLCTCAYLSATSDITLAQVTSDNTVNTQVDQNGSVAEITGGETRGDNLFHSFREFSVRTGNEAFFNNAESIANIFSRVTGGKVSNIDGLIRANGSASLFLINPQGIIFGENARLDLGGSFLGSSASGILFEDGEFSAVDNLDQPILTINAPVGLSFRDEPGDIENNSTASADFTELNPSVTFDDNLFGLRVPDGKTFALAGGDITADGGGIVAVGGRIELGAVRESGTVGIDFEDDNISFNFPDDLAKANVSLTNNAGFLVSGSGGGDIAITANNIEILQGSGLFAGIFNGLGSPDAQAGDIALQANESILIDGITENNDFSRVFNEVDSDSLGNAGTLTINAANLSVTNGAQVSTSTNGQGNGGDIFINAANSVFLDVGDNDAFTSIFSNVQSNSLGNSGGVNINADFLSVNGGAQIQSLVRGEGNSGKITVNANSVSFDGRDQSDFPSGAFSVVTQDAIGSVGGIEIIANSFSMTNRAQLLSNTSGMGDAGNIDLQVMNGVNLDNSSILSEVSEGSGNGSGGDINITTTSLLLQNGSALLADAENIGDAGDININASDSVILSGEGISAFPNSTNIVPSQISATVESGATGKGGNINIGTEQTPVKNLSIADDGFISASTFDRGDSGNLTIYTEQLMLESGSELQAISFDDGDAGNLTINALESVNVSGTAPDGQSPSGIFASAFNGTGNGGNLTIATDELIVQDKGTIAVGNFQIVFGETEPLPFGTGEAGNLTVNARSVQLNNEGTITAANASGKGGSLTINTDSLSLDNQGLIEASTISETGVGGNINLNINNILQMRDNSLISARATEGAIGGDIDIDTDFIIAFPNQIDGNGNDIIANAVRGNGGEININAESLLGIQERQADDNNRTNDIDASSRFRLDGTVTINTPDINPLQGATELPTNVVVPQQTTTQACQADREAAAKNGLTIKGKGGVPPAPHLPLNSQNITINGNLADGDRENSNQMATSTIKPLKFGDMEIMPARGVVKTADGRVLLTAYATDEGANRLDRGAVNCNSVQSQGR